MRFGRRPASRWIIGTCFISRGMTKGQLRTPILHQLKQQKEEERRQRSEAIRRKVFRLTAFRRAKTVCCYVALPYEVQTWRMIEEMIESGKRVVVPVTAPRKRLWVSEVRDPSTELGRGAHGVWEPRPGAGRPVPLRDVDLVLVPGVAFDRRGHRLGHGLGYFNRFLSRLPRTIPTIGLAFRFQVLDRLPAASHDRAVQTVLSA